MPSKVWSTIKSGFERIGKTISNIVNFILLSIIYFIGIGPVAVISKLMGKHFLEPKKDSRKSNWHEHKVEKQPLDKYYRTF